MATGKAWIVCPCLFDIPSFSRLKTECCDAVAGRFPGMEVHFVLVDDSAGTDAEVQSLGGDRGVTVMGLPYNMGHQAALVYALRSLSDRVAETDFVVTMDSDGEDRPSDLPAMLSALMESGARLSQVALAWRTQRRESAVFKAGYLLFKLFFRILVGRIIRNGNFAAFRGWFLKEVIFHPGFDQCYASTFISLPLQIRFIPLPRGTRYFGESKMGFFGLITHGLRMVMPFSERVATRLICAFGFLSLVGVAAILWIGRRAGVVTAELLMLTLFSAAIAALAFLLFVVSSQFKGQSLGRLRAVSSRSHG